MAILTRRLRPLIEAFGAFFGLWGALRLRRWIRRFHWGEAWYRLRRGPMSVHIDRVRCGLPPTDDRPLIAVTRDRVVLENLVIHRTGWPCPAPLPTEVKGNAS